MTTLALILSVYTAIIITRLVLFAVVRPTRPTSPAVARTAATEAEWREGKWLREVNAVHEALGLPLLTRDGSPYVPITTIRVVGTKMAHPEDLRFIPDETPAERELRFAEKRVARVRRAAAL